MADRSTAVCFLGWALALGAVATTGCGGSSEEESYPVLFPLYGGGEAGAYPNPARFGQTFTWPDGETWSNDCEGTIRVLSQEGAAWTGRAERGVWNWGVTERCHSSGEIVGEVGMDHSLHFRLTQERWKAIDFPAMGGQWVECTAVGPGEYAGHLDKNRFYAIGTTRLVCEDGREGTVQEIMSGSYPAPSGTHDT